ncbi:hypothetical protein [Sphingomonas sp. Leaf37]|uniref:hypothetical protein n=1 Tax=Sphingomonas sp. Leaf37 TaxID=2876552 RepID=UPI001E635120|nr:hypothetical protein [Sphingomonas sp. Leaf37]
MKHYMVTAELVDETSGKRFMPGDTFMPASEKQRKRLTDAGCLGDEEVDPLDGLDDLPLGVLTREHLENIAFAIARQQIADASDDDLRDGIASHRERRNALANAEAFEQSEGGAGGTGGEESSGTGSGAGDDDRADGLDGKSIPQLKKVAEEENIDLTGKTQKADIIPAIRAARVTRADALRGEG